MKVVIFDYDGLLVDTEGIWFQSCVEVCKSYGVEVREEHRFELMRSGLSAYLVERFSLPDSVPNVKVKLYSTFDNLSATGIKLLPGVKNAVEELSKKYILAIGTGARTSQVNAALKDLNLFQYFKVIVGADQVNHVKPAPDIFLKVADDLGVQPADCLVIEDHPKGVLAAKAAGMKCIAVPNRYLLNADYSSADAVIESLEAVTSNFIETIMN